MKKIFNSIILLIAAVSTATVVTSCKDDDTLSSATDRQFMTMFICDNTRGKGTDYPYNCGLDGAYPHGNTIHLYWYGVNECAGYQIQMALQPKVSGGQDAWESIQGTSDLLLDTIIKPEQLDLVLKDLQYSTNYRFCIRALSDKDENIIGDASSFAHASNWYGRGNLRQWQEYLNITTLDRYPTPLAIYVNQAQTTETEMYLYLNRTVNQALGYQDGVEITDEDDKDKVDAYYDNFNIGADGTLGYSVITVVPSPSNPNSTVGEKWKRYELTEEDFERGYVKIDGLTPNSVYVIDAIDPRVEVAIDAKYNTVTARSDGNPGPPILLKHDELLATQNSAEIPNNSESRAEVFSRAAEFNAAPLTPTLYDFISNTNYAEGQTFELEGGKTYYLDGNDITSKGFVLRTNPEDVKAGKRARVICGIGMSSKVFTQGVDGKQWDGCPYSMFTFGRSPEAGESGEIYMKKLAFHDIDFDNPLCFNEGDKMAGLGSPTGNYFFNMFSDGMAVTLDSLVIENCSFQRLVRGFVREQGPNYKVWNHVLIKNNLFNDCGYYSNGAGGYCWIDGISKPGSNLYKDFKVIENTFYDSPFPAFFSEQNTDNMRDNGAWKITFSNNTLVNFNTRADGSIFKMRQLPDGSVFTVENNLFVLCKQPNDQRVLGMWGNDIRETQIRPDGSSGVVTLIFSNNWSTNNDLTNGQIFSGNAWNTTSNSFGKLVKDGSAVLTSSSTLDVHVADISATELMVQPCPPHAAQSSDEQNMHRADALDGTATTGYNVNLYFKNTDNDIYRNNVGAARWRNGRQ